MGEQHGHVEELLESSRADDPGLAQESVDDLVRLRERPGVRARRARPGARAARLDGDDRLASRNAPGDPREADRVAEALEVEQDDVGPRVLGPVLDQVVARDVRLVSDRDEGRDPEVELRRVVEQGEAERSALGGQGHASLGRIDRAERGVQAELRIGVDQAHAVGADHPHARGANLVEQGNFAAASLVAGLGKARRDDDDPGHSLGRAVVDGGFDEFARHRDHGEVHGSRNVDQARIAAHALHLLRARVDRHDRPLEDAVEVVEDLGADLSALAARPDDRDNVRLEEALHRGERGARGPVRGLLLERGRRRDREDDALHAGLGPPLLRLEAAAAKHVDHPAVVAEDLRFEGRDAMGTGNFREAFEQPRADPLTLQGILDGEGDLGAVRVVRQPKVVRDRHEPPADLPDQRELVVVVHAAEAGGLLRVHPRQREESKVETVGGESLVEGEKRRGVLAADRAKPQGRSGPQNDVPLLLRGIRGRGGRLGGCGRGGLGHGSSSRKARRLDGRAPDACGS